MAEDRIEAILSAGGWVLPQPLVMPAPNRRPWILVGQTLYLSGHGSALLDESVGPARIGKVPSEVSQAEAARVAEAVALKMLATIRDAVGRLDTVAQVVKLTGYVNCDPDFDAIGRAV